MYSPQRNWITGGLAAFVGVSLAIAPVVAIPAAASTAGTGVIISEAYVNGGSNGATYLNKFVELYNPTDAAIDLSAMSIQYRSASGTANPTGVIPLTGSIAPGAYYLVHGNSNGGSTNPGAPLPAADAAASVSFSGSGGTLFLANQTTALTAPPIGSVLNNALIIDLIGYGSSNTFETAVAPAPSLTTSLNRTLAVDTDTNSADYTALAPTPTNAAGEVGDPTPAIETPAAGTPVAISAIQGTGDASPLVGTTVTTRGVVTASYSTGGFDGYYIQTPGTGSALSGASDGIFVYSPATVAEAKAGSYVEVTGTVAEFFGMTQISVVGGALTVLGEVVAPPVPATVTLTSDPVQRESLEGMLLAPAGDFTITDNYNTNYYGSIVLTAGATPLVQPTSVVEPGSPEYTAMLAANAAAEVTLDDGATTNFNSSANKGTALPYLSTENPVRIGAAVEFTGPVVLDYRYSSWNFQPLQQLTAANAATVQPATFENTREAAPATVGGDVTFATFNVLNYFSTTGDSITGCTYYTDRAGTPITVRGDCDARGAADAASLERQQDKIVSAINTLGADVVALEEIENSAAFGKDRDQALRDLTDALNADAGSGTWAFVPSPTAVPADEDVIRTAFIYTPATVETVGESVILDDAVAFSNARKPLAQAFNVAGGAADSKFLAIVNHFKSKGSGSGTGDVDSGDGQGASNGSRVRQAEALVVFANGLRAETAIDRVLLAGDFNSYLKEDPIDVLVEAGYVDQGSKSGEHTYSYGGAVGSLDYVFASPEADASVAGVDIWNINSVESIALEYSRYNYNAADLYEPNAFRSSDHDPILVGLALTTELIDVNLLNINDFHGRIDSNTTKFATTVEQLRAEEGEGNTLFLSAGDQLGASLFASASQNDQPTIDVLNSLGLAASAVGNHEFDRGFADLNGRVAAAADWNYLGANVYLAGTTTPAMQEYEIFEIDGVRVAIIGAITQETPSLVSPAGVAALDFGDPVEAVNRVVAALEEADLADVIVAEYHEGAGAGTPDGATIEEELALTDSAFAAIVTETAPEVDAIFTGHTHKQYSWDAPITGRPGETRPILQTGSYGAFVGQIRLSYNPATEEVEAYTARNVARASAENLEFARVAAVKLIVTEAIRAAAVIGSKPIGTVASDITRASTSTTEVVEDRGAESTLGNLVANSLVSSLSDSSVGGAEIGVVNPGGLRADLLYASSPGGEGAGVVTYAEANAVLPFLNNLGTTTLTGAQFKVLLEQQWQTDADGRVPSRPFLNLGLSDNVNYTFEAARAQGDRVTGITIAGAAIDPAREYRIGTFNFLLEGGDNFRVFTEGTATRDSGLVDRDAWISYISANDPLEPQFDRRGVSVTDVPSEIAVGADGTVTLSNLDLTSLGSPLNTLVSASFEGSSAAPVDSAVTAGRSTVAFTVPTDAGANPVLVIVARESGSTVRIAMNVPTVDDPGIGSDDETETVPTDETDTASTSEDLAYTGSEPVPVLLAGALLLLLGGALTVARRRRLIGANTVPGA